MIQANMIKCTTDEFEEYQEFARQTFVDTYQHNTDAANLQKYVDENFSEEAIAKELTDPQCAIFMLKAGDEILGYVKLRWNTAHPQLDKKSIELQRIYVQKDYYGKGYGKTLLAYAEQFGRENGFDWIWLCVWFENHGAIRFYEREGWEKFGETQFRFGDIVYTDPVFRKGL